MLFFKVPNVKAMDRRIRHVGYGEMKEKMSCISSAGLHLSNYLKRLKL